MLPSCSYLQYIETHDRVTIQVLFRNILREGVLTIVFPAPGKPILAFPLGCFCAFVFPSRRRSCIFAMTFYWFSMGINVRRNTAIFLKPHLSFLQNLNIEIHPPLLPMFSAWSSVNCAGPNGVARTDPLSMLQG